jgi:predicted PurR-regulated permease PerM
MVERPTWPAAPALWILAVVATIFFLRTASTLLIPIALGVLISYALEPIVAWLERHRVHRTVGASLLLLGTLGLLAWGAYALRDDVTTATEALPEVARRVRSFVDREHQAGPAAHIQEAVEELRADRSAPAEARPAGTSGRSAAPGGGQDAGAGAGRSVGGAAAASERASPAAPTSGLDAELVTPLQQLAGSLVSIAGQAMVVVFLVFFLLLSGNHFRRRVIEIAGPQLQRRRLTAQIIDDISHQVQRFLLVRLVTGVIVAAATWAVLAWMDVGQAAVWGILAGVFNSIPYFGPVIVSGGLLVVGLLQGDLAQALKMSGAALAITSVEGWLLTPPLMGRAEHMNAVVVFVGLLLWTWIWGAWGTILAVPMLVIVKSVADHVESLRPISRLMSS